MHHHSLAQFLHRGAALDELYQGYFALEESQVLADACLGASTESQRYQVHLPGLVLSLPSLRHKLKGFIEVLFGVEDGPGVEGDIGALDNGDVCNESVCLGYSLKDSLNRPMHSVGLQLHTV